MEKKKRRLELSKDDQEWTNDTNKGEMESDPIVDSMESCPESALFGTTVQQQEEILKLIKQEQEDTNASYGGQVLRRSNLRPTMYLKKPLPNNTTTTTTSATSAVPSKEVKSSIKRQPKVTF